MKNEHKWVVYDSWVSTHFDPKKSQKKNWKKSKKQKIFELSLHT